MDQEPLVIEQIEAGKRFIDEFDKYVPVGAAFWLKASEDSGWYLYIASDQITDENFDVAYGEVARLARKIADPNLDLFQVKLIGVRDPFVRAALDLYRRYPARIPTRIRGRQFGGMSVEEVYLYPPPVTAVSK
jgi:hypothetical protein